MGLFGLFGKKSAGEVSAEERQRAEEVEKSSLNEGLKKTRKSLFERLSRAVVGKSIIDEEVLDSIEEALIGSDIGVDTTQNIIERLEKCVAKNKYLNVEELNDILCEQIEEMLGAAGNTDDDPFDFSKKQIGRASCRERV